MPDTIQELTITFFLNEREITVPVSPDTTALVLLRDYLHLTGTKESCSEGDCGACTIALGTLQDGKITYRAVNACLLPAVRLHGKHVITIEGLSEGNRLHLIQQAMLDHHATQCGYCTPGIIMSLFCLFAGQNSPDSEAILSALEGNLCRCTGYQSILSAAETCATRIGTSGASEAVLPPYVPAVERKLRSFSQPIAVEEHPDSGPPATLGYFLPHTTGELFDLLDRFANPNEYRLLCGGTDVMVELNVHRRFPRQIIDISGIPEFDTVREEDDTLIVGAAVTYDQLLRYPALTAKWPVLAQTIRTIGSTQIRSVGTLAGNVANASPIADGTVTLLGLNAELTLLSGTGPRTIPLQEFFKDYKQTDLQPGEIIAEIRIPRPTGFCNFEKASKRIALDIASVNSCCAIEYDGDRVTQCRFAFGGMDKIPRLAPQCSRFLVGKQVTTGVIHQCAEIAASEFTPISDVRGSADFRLQLVYNQVLQHLHRFFNTIDHPD